MRASLVNLQVASLHLGIYLINAVDIPTLPSILLRHTTGSRCAIWFLTMANTMTPTAKKTAMARTTICRGIMARKDRQKMKKSGLYAYAKCATCSLHCFSPKALRCLRSEERRVGKECG